MSKRAATVSLAAVALMAAGLGTAGVAAADEHEGPPLPLHGHMLLLDATLEFGPNGPEITYGKCIDLANAKKLKLNAHHEHFHFGRAGEAQLNAGHAIVPTAPVFDIPWTDCASFAGFFPPD